MALCRLAVPLVLVVATGCVTPEMGQSLKEKLDLVPPHSTTPEHATAFDRDASLPLRIWYVDPFSQVYHERRTNTYVVFDDMHRGWIAVSRESAFKDFRPERANLLMNGAPPEVKQALDYMVSMSPNWRGL